MILCIMLNTVAWLDWYIRYALYVIKSVKYIFMTYHVFVKVNKHFKNIAFIVLVFMILVNDNNFRIYIKKLLTLESVTRPSPFLVGSNKYVELYLLNL